MRVYLFNNTPARSMHAVPRDTLYGLYRDWILRSIVAYNERYQEQPRLELSSFTAFDVTTGEYPTSLDQVDWILLTGGTDAAYSDSIPWLTAEIRYMRDVLLNHTRIKVTAVCFGLHVITRALGGVVGENDRGVEIGIKNIELTKCGRTLFERDSIRLHQLHFCIVQQLPERCESIGCSDVTPHQGYVLGNQALVLQGHPEFTKAIVDAYLAERPGHFGDLPEVRDDHDGLDVGVHIIRFVASS